MSSENLSPEEQKNRQNAQRCFKAATEAMSKENWDYAIAMFGQCATFVPDNVMYRQNLRGCEFRKYNNNGSGASMSGMRLMGIRGKIKKARGASNWPEMDKAAEEGLQVNPWDGQLNADLGEAAKARGYDEIAVFAYELAVKADPKSKEFWQGLAEAKAQKHDYVGAGQCWEKIYALDPMDGQARSMIQAMHSEATIYKSKMAEAKTTREVKQGYEESVSGKQSGTVAADLDDPVAVLERAIKKDPANKDNYVKLGDLHLREGRLQQSLDWFTKGYEVSSDLTIRERAEDVQLEMLRKNVDAAKQLAAKKPDDEHVKEGVVAVVKELLNQEIEFWTRRTERYPQNMRLKQELAERLMRVRQYPLATKLLQQASADVRIEGPVLLALGKCFLAQKQNALAMRQFEKAVQRFSAADTPTQFLECHYLLGRLQEEAKELESAESHYLEVIGTDYDYKDARDRLEKIQASRGNAGLSELADI